MRHFIRLSTAAGMVVVLLAGTGSAALVRFDPLVISVSAGTPALLGLTIESGLPSGINFADIVIGSNDIPSGPANRISFQYSTACTNALENVTAVCPDPNLPNPYNHSVYVGGNNPTSVGGSLFVGTVTVDTSGLLDDDYTIEINSVDGVSAVGFGTEVEPLSGSASIHIPEPASILLFAFTGLFWRRRRTG